MSDKHEQLSLAVQAHCTQNFYTSSAEHPKAKPSDTVFPGHDTFQNGIVENGQPTTFYAAATNEDIENIKNHNSKMSGFLTDDATLNACKNENGVLDANQYAGMTQTRPWRPADAPPGAEYTYRENIAAFNVNWDKLNDPNNVDLKERLCDKQGNLKCAFGKAEENAHWGNGGGNQYYINKADFNEAVNRGIFEYDDKKTLKESNGTLTRAGVSENEMRLMDIERQGNVEKALSSCQDKNATSDAEKAKSLNEITPEKANQINSANASAGNYLAKPDPAYNAIAPSNEDVQKAREKGVDLDGLLSNPQNDIAQKSNGIVVSAGTGGIT